MTRSVVILLDDTSQADVVTEDRRIPVDKRRAVLGDDPDVGRTIVDAGRILVLEQAVALRSKVAGQADLCSALGRADSFHVAFDLVVAGPPEQQAVEEDGGILAAEHLLRNLGPDVQRPAPYVDA